MTWVIYEDKAYRVVDLDDDGDDWMNDDLCLVLLSFLNPFGDTDELWVRRRDIRCYYEDEIASILENHYKKEST